MQQYSILFYVERGGTKPQYTSEQGSNNVLSIPTSRLKMQRTAEGETAVVRWLDFA